MYKTVDSNEQMLENNDLIEIAIKNMRLFEGQKVPENLQVAAVIAEFDQPQVMVVRFGNTLFELIPNEKGSAYFKSLNADTARNFLQNSMEFIRWAKENEGLQYLITQFKDKNLLNIFKAISMNPPYPGMGYQAVNTKNGEIRVVVNLGS